MCFPPTGIFVVAAERAQQTRTEIDAAESPPDRVTA